MPNDPYESQKKGQEFTAAFKELLKAPGDVQLLLQQTGVLLSFLEGATSAGLLIDIVDVVIKLNDRCPEALKPYFVDVVDVLIGLGLPLLLWGGGVKRAFFGGLWVSGRAGATCVLKAEVLQCHRRTSCCSGLVLCYAMLCYTVVRCGVVWSAVMLFFRF